MDIKVFKSNFFSENCYAAITDDGIFLVDPGEYTGKLRQFVLENADKIQYILLTHRHVDHISGTAMVLKECSKAKVVIHELDARGLTDTTFSLATLFGVSQEIVEPDVLVTEGSVIKMGNTSITVLHTPGHTAGSVCYCVGDNIFCGDTIFKGSCGRTDLPSGNSSELLSSLQRLKNLLCDATLYPGHDDVTTLSHERSFNPYLTEY